MQSGSAQNVLFSDYAQSCIRVKARQLSRRSEFNLSDEDDLAQDLWLSLLKKADGFDPERASLNTFTDRVVNTSAAMILRRPYRQKRASGSRAISLDATKVSLDGDAKRPLAQLVSDADLSRRTSAPRHDDAAIREDAVAIEHALSAMPEEIRDVCRRVMGGSIASAARDLRTSRHCIRDLLRAAQPYLERSGFNNG